MPSRRVQAAIKGDGDETVEEPDEDLDDSDGPKIRCQSQLLESGSHDPAGCDLRDSAKD